MTTLDGYVVCATLAIFPNGAHDALAAALALQRRVDELNDAAGTEETIAIGIGVHAGPMVPGTIGESQRMDAEAYTTRALGSVAVRGRTERIPALEGTGIGAQVPAQ